jgi:hypothetical protein
VKLANLTDVNCGSFLKSKSLHFNFFEVAACAAYGRLEVAAIAAYGRVWLMRLVLLYGCCL